MLNINELRKTKLDELYKLANDADLSIAKEKFNIKAKKNNKTAQLKMQKKDLARVLTVINELKVINNISLNAK